MKKKMTSLLLVLATCCFSAGCQNAPPTTENNPPSPTVTAYTEEEQVGEIVKRTEQRFYEELLYDIKTYDVELLYDFDGKPTYFLVEFEYVAKRDYVTARGDTVQTQYAHIIGYMYKNEFYSGIRAYYEPMAGKSAYTLCGCGDVKKYYEYGFHAIEEDGKIAQIFAQGEDSTHTVEFDSEAAQWEKKDVDRNVIEELRCYYAGTRNFYPYRKR